MKSIRSSFTLVELMIILFIVGCVAAIGIGPLFGTDPQGTTRLLQAQGYTQIQITGYRWFVGGERDFYHTGFKAKSPSGQEITGTVTRGLIFKNTTIRFD